MISSTLRAFSYAITKGKHASVCVENMLFQCLIAFFADNVFHAARILCGDILRDTKLYKPALYQLMSLIDHPSNLATRVCLIYVSGISYSNMLLLTKILHCNADT